jgi:hypothetical protein
VSLSMLRHTYSQANRIQRHFKIDGEVNSLPDMPSRSFLAMAISVRYSATGFWRITDTNS